MSGRSGRGRVLALAGTALVLLTTTQPWLAGLTAPAPGVPRLPQEASGADLVPWAAALALVVTLLVVVALTGRRWAGWSAAAALVPVVAAPLVVLGVLPPGRGSVAPELSGLEPTGWLWTALVGAVLALVGAVWGELGATVAAGSSAAGGPTSRTGTPRPAAGIPLSPAEQSRRRDAEAWAALSRDDDPTEG